MVGLQPHPQRRAQRPAGQVDLDPAGPAVPVVLDRPADQAMAAVPSAGRADLLAGPARSGAARPEPAAGGTA